MTKKRTFLRFEGAFSVTELFINNRLVGEHRGGYGVFCFDIPPIYISEKERINHTC